MGQAGDLLTDRFVNRTGDSMTGPLLLSGDPILDMHAATKRYVDLLNANMGINALPRDGSLPMLGPLTLPGAPTNPNEAANMNYVDILRAFAIAQDNLRLLLAGGNMTGDIVLAGAPTLPLHPATMAYTDAADALRLLLAGGTLTGPLILDADPLVAMGAATRQYVDAVPPGQPIFDAVVDAGGGYDYTDIVTACATEAAGARIFVVRGTYNETANIVMKDNQMLEGQNPEDTVIDFGAANRKITTDGAGTNRSIKNLTVQGSTANYTIELNSTYDRVENCRVIGSVNANIGLIMSGLYSVCKDCYFVNFDKAGTYSLYMANTNGLVIGNTFDSSQRGVYAGSSYCNVIGNFFLSMTNLQITCLPYANIVGNQLYGLTETVIQGAGVRIVGNMIRGDINWGTSDFDWIVIANNFQYLSEIRCVQANAHSCTIQGNVFSGGDGIDWAGHSSSINGNSFDASAHIQLAANARHNVITGNNLMQSTEPNLTRINDLGLRGNQAFGNQGVNVLQEKNFVDMKNTSGGALADGDCVVMKAVAAGNEFDTTVNIGDDMVLGMVNEAINNNAEGMVQTEGFTDMLKVNGVINIAVGDLLGTFNAAGIAQQAQAGDMAFAIALEAYAGADSLGVIDALLITPRKV